MIPLESAAVILPSMPTGRTITGEFPLTIMKAPALEVKARASPSAVSSPVYRLLRRRDQRKNSSASSVRSGCSTTSERKELMTDTVEVFELKETDQYVVKNELQKTCTLPDNVHDCNENTAPSRQSILISSAKERHVCIQERPSGLMPEQDGVDNDRHQLVCNSTDLREESRKFDNFPAEETDLKSEDVPSIDSKEKEISPLEKVNKKTRRKLSKAKRTQRKGKKSVQKGPGVTGIFARLVGSQAQKKQHGPINSNELRKQRASSGHQVHGTSPNKYLYIQKLRAAYAPKKNDNKNHTVLLPRVDNNTSVRDNAVNEQYSPRKQDQQLENVSIIVSPSMSSPCKLLNSDDDKVKKVYLSETHSGMIAGIPCAPPSTPSIDELKKVEYIPSLTDVKSQRAVKTRLVNLDLCSQQGDDRT